MSVAESRTRTTDPQTLDNLGADTMTSPEMVTDRGTPCHEHSVCASRKEYGSGNGLVRALDVIDLKVNRGEAVAVMGPSGGLVRRSST